tara:strand:+ start:2925 stop:3332 length:408 start_codon:yes stop_codon:yes gene_type:complete
MKETKVNVLGIDAEEVGEGVYKVKQHSVTAMDVQIMQMQLAGLQKYVESQKVEIKMLKEALTSKEEPILDRPFNEDFDIQSVLHEVRKYYITRALINTGGHYTKASKLLGLNNYQTLVNWIKRYKYDVSLWKQYH